MRVRRAHEHRMQRVGPSDVIDEASLSGQQSIVLAPCDGLPDAELHHGSLSVREDSTRALRAHRAESLVAHGQVSAYLLRAAHCA